MKTIEERIEEKYGQIPYTDPDYCEPDGKEASHLSGLREGYAEGAKEQLAIDINKAVSYLIQNGYFKNSTTAESFRKHMEQ